MYLIVIVFSVGLWHLTLGHGGGTCLTSCPVKAGKGDYSYDPSVEGGPRGWGGITGYETCGNGEIQSPIDFSSTARMEAPLADGPKAHMKSAPLAFNAGVENWALQCAEPGTCGYTMINGKRFNVFNLHFHAPAEHVMDGGIYPLEAHVVHASDNKQLVVIAILFNYPTQSNVHNDTSPNTTAKEKLAQGSNAFIQNVLNNVEQDTLTFDANLSEIVDLSEGVCSYSGSLTTPPCTEGVTFLMQTKILNVSKLQVHKYRLATGFNIHGNNRPVQPLNNRNITCFTDNRLSNSL